MSCVTKCYKTFHRYLPNFVDIVLLITLNIRIKYEFLSHKLQALINCQSFKVKISKTNNENSTKTSYWASYYTCDVGEVQKPQLNLMQWKWQLVCLVKS